MVNKLHPDNEADQPVVNHEHKMALDNQGHALILVDIVERGVETMIVSHIFDASGYYPCIMPMSNGSAYSIIRALELWRKW